MHWPAYLAILCLLLGFAAALKESFSVCSFNVWGLYISKYREVRIQALARFLNNSTHYDFDIVGLQELWMDVDYEYLKLELAEKYPHSAYFHSYQFMTILHILILGSGAVGSGLATFSKYPIQEVQFRRFSIGGRPEHIFKGDWFAAKGSAITKLIHPSGQRITLLNTHMAASYNRTIGGFDGYETHRLIHAFEFGRLFEEQRRLDGQIIGVGDFNLQPESKAYKAFLADEYSFISEQHIRSAFKAEPLSYNALNNTFSKSYEQSQAIDHIFYTGLASQSSRMIFHDRVPHFDISLSDHYGIAAEFTFQSESPLDSEDPNFGVGKYQMGRAISERIHLHIECLQGERRNSYLVSTLFMLICIGLFTWALLLTFPAGIAPRFSLKSGLLFTNAVLFFIFGFTELFKGFAFVGEEIAAHKQFLQDFGILCGIDY